MRRVTQQMGVFRQPHKPHFHVSAGLIWRKGKLLITRRPEGSHLAGLWEFPGGKKRDGETLEECLAREIKEELGIEVIAEKPVLTVQHEYETKAVTLHFFNCTDWKGLPTPMEGQEAEWVAPIDLKKYSFPPPDIAILNYLEIGKYPGPKGPALLSSQRGV